MRISLYRFNGKSNVANKIDNLQALYSADITPYGAFDSTNVVFILDRLLDANICKYEYNNHEYYGTCEVNVDADNAYVYNVKSDSLTTAWYNDCMNTNCAIQYSMSGDRKKNDKRLFYKDYQKTFYYDIYGLIEEYVVIMTVRKVNIGGTDSIISNPMFQSYMFSFVQFSNFLNSLNHWTYSGWTTEELQTKYLPSVHSLYIIPKRELKSWIYSAEESNNVWLSPTIGSSDDISLSINVIGGVTYKSHRIYEIRNDNLDYSQLIEIDDPLNYPLTANRQNSVFTLHVQDAGDFTFKYSDVSEGHDINRVGYSVAFDFVSGTKNVYLAINGQIRKNYALSAPIAYTFPISYDNSVTRWDQMRSALAGSFINMGKSIPGAVTGVGLFNAAATIAQETIKDIQLERDYNFNYNMGSRGTVGGIGGSASDVTKYYSFLTIQESVPIDVSGYQALFGYPDGVVRRINTLKGYVKTGECKLTENGLPRRIIDEAESACDAGFYII